MAAREKTSMSWVLSLGYLFVALIILINYISQKSEQKTLPAVGIKKLTTEYENPEFDKLKAQLSDERRVNREMSEMIQRLQNEIKFHSREIWSDSPASYGANLGREQLIEEMVTKGTFDLNHFLKSSLNSQPIVLSSGRNPFIPYETKKRIIGPIDGNSPAQTHRFKTDPKVPIPFVSSLFSANVSGASF